MTAWAVRAERKLFLEHKHMPISFPYPSVGSGLDSSGFSETKGWDAYDLQGDTFKGDALTS